MVNSFVQVYKSVLLRGVGAWALAMAAGVVTAVRLNTDTLATVLTAWDLTAILLLFPWFLAQGLAGMTRRTIAERVECDGFEASNEAVARDIREGMERSTRTGGFSTYLAVMALVVLGMDLLVRTATGSGYTLLPLLR